MSLNVLISNLLSDNGVSNELIIEVVEASRHLVDEHMVESVLLTLVLV